MNYESERQRKRKTTKAIGEKIDDDFIIRCNSSSIDIQMNVCVSVAMEGQGKSCYGKKRREEEEQ